MIPEKEYLEVAKGLLERSRRGNVNWTESSSSGNPIYTLALPKSSIQLRFLQPNADPDYYLLTLFNNENGKPVGSWKVSEGDNGWELMEELHSEVTKQVTGWEKVLEDVKKFVGT